LFPEYKIDIDRRGCGPGGLRVMHRLLTRSCVLASGVLAGALIASSNSSSAQTTAQQVPVLTVVSIGDQRISVYGPHGQIARGGVSTGMKGHATPAGFFSILQKNRHHESNIYSGAPMPFMQRLTWSGIALHEGHLPGHPASHGCIRLSSSFAQQLWGMTRLGNRVVVAPGDTTVTPIAHPGLPIAHFKLPPDGAVSVAVEPGATTGRRRRGLLQTIAMTVEPTQAPSTEPVNPITYAQALKVSLARQISVASDAARDALATAADRSAAHRTARATIAGLQRDIDRLASDLGAVGRMADQGTHRGALDATVAHGADLEHELEDKEDLLAHAIEEEKLRNEDAFAAAAAARATEKQIDALNEALREANRRLEPVSVLVSRKEGRVFIRQGFVPVFDAAVSIRDDDRPLGSHLLMAMSEDGSRQGSLRWIAATPDAASAGVSAAAALERIELPAEARAIIAERMWIGGTLLITDQGISTETGKGTDFVVLLK
jgi:SAM-dependent methyltransferase